LSAHSEIKVEYDIDNDRKTALEAHL